MRPRSIRVRMTGAFVAAIAVILLAVCGSVMVFSWRSAERSADTVLAAMGERVAHDLESEGVNAALEDELPDLRIAGIGFVLMNDRGVVIRRSGSFAPPVPAQNASGWRVLPVKSGAFTLLVGMRWEKEVAALRRQLAILVLVSTSVLLAAGVGAWVLVGRTLSPISALSSQADAASAENIRVQLAAPSNDAEVIGLVETLNGLLSRQADAAAARGRFYAAASHELRTPLQALSGHLEVARARERDRDEYQLVVDEAYAQTRRLVSLVQDLLLLNQIDTCASIPPRETVALVDVVEWAMGQFVSVVRDRGLSVRVDVASAIAIEAPPSHLDMLVRNLIENAVKYATAGGSVHVTGSTTADGDRLEICNDALPLDPQVASHLFEPFFRADTSRSSTSEGNGLGLAICKAIATANQWSILFTPGTDGFRIGVLFRPPQVS